MEMGSKWRWVPDGDCELLDITPQSFCDLLGDRTIGFFGDSTMDQTMYSLQGYLHATSCVDSILPKLNNEAPQMEAKNLLRKQLEQFFSSPSKSSSDQGGNNKNKKIDILLMNLDTWHQNMPMFQEELQFLQDDIKYLQSLQDPNYHDIDYLWRLNVVPHRRCDEYDYPFVDYFNDSQRAMNVFQSYDFYDFKAMIETLQIPILEVTEALAMRPNDALVVNDENHLEDDDSSSDEEEIFDCAHSCLVGSGMDVQIQMLAHYLYYHNQLHPQNHHYLRSGVK